MADTGFLRRGETQMGDVAPGHFERISAQQPHENECKIGQGHRPLIRQSFQFNI